MILEGITELTLMTVLERGIPNKECIAIEINESIDLGQFGIMLGGCPRIGTVARESHFESDFLVI